MIKQNPNPKINRKDANPISSEFFSELEKDSNFWGTDFLEDYNEQSRDTSCPNLKSRERITAAEVYSVLRTIMDPEHPLTLEELNVISEERITVTDTAGMKGSSGDGKRSGDGKTSENIDKMFVNNRLSVVSVEFTPTIPHCSLATLIGLSLTVKLQRSLPPRFKIKVSITPGTHASEFAVNKQIADKERVAAALENDALLAVVNRCIS